MVMSPLRSEAMVKSPLGLEVMSPLRSEVMKPLRSDAVQAVGVLGLNLVDAVDRVAGVVEGITASALALMPSRYDPCGFTPRPTPYTLHHAPYTLHLASVQ